MMENQMDLTIHRKLLFSVKGVVQGGKVVPSGPMTVAMPGAGIVQESGRITRRYSDPRSGRASTSMETRIVYLKTFL